MRLITTRSVIRSLFRFKTIYRVNLVFCILFCLVQDVIPGFTFKAKPTFALEFMPTAFPVQTRMRARMHFFYVRNRNLWKDFADFYGKDKGRPCSSLFAFSARYFVKSLTFKYSKLYNDSAFYYWWFGRFGRRFLLLMYVKLLFVFRFLVL